MKAEEIIKRIATSKKRTEATCILKSKVELDFSPFSFSYFGTKNLMILIGEYKEIEEALQKYSKEIIDSKIECKSLNQAIPLLEFQHLNARIEPGAIIRDMVEIQDHAVIMMGAILNIGACVGKNTMIDMGAVLGGRAIVKDNCHIGAGAVLAGVVEPASAKPVIVEDDVLVGANAVVVEGVHIGKGAVVAAGSVVLEDVEPYTVVGGVPARVLKKKDDQTKEKTALIEALRFL